MRVLTWILWISLWGCGDGALPADYRDLAVPEGRLASAAARASGRELYLEHCALCHGERADGRGRRRNLSSRPADFTSAAWRRDADPRRVYVVIREGLRGTPMAGWKTLEPDQTWDLVAYLLSVAPHEP